MRVISLKTLRLFWEQHPDAQQALQAWYHDARRADWRTPADIKEEGILTMEVRPIRSDEDYQAALAEIERLFDAARNTPEADRLEVLTTLVEAYEARHFSIPAPDPIEAIEYYMESRGLTRSDLARYLGSRHRVADILSRRRPLSLDMIRRLHAGLGIPADVLIQPYAVYSSPAS